MELNNSFEEIKLLGLTAFDGTFEGCSSLTSIPERLFEKCVDVTLFGSTFYGCTGLSNYNEIPNIAK